MRQTSSFHSRFAGKLLLGGIVSSVGAYIARIMWGIPGSGENGASAVALVFFWFAAGSVIEERRLFRQQAIPVQVGSFLLSLLVAGAFLSVAYVSSGAPASISFGTLPGAAVGFASGLAGWLISEPVKSFSGISRAQK